MILISGRWWVELAECKVVNGGSNPSGVSQLTGMIMRKPENIDQALWDTLTTKEKIFVSEHEHLHMVYAEKYRKYRETQDRAWRSACEVIINTQI